MDIAVFSKKVYNIIIAIYYLEFDFFITFSLDKDYTVYEFIKGFWFLPRGGITGVLTQPWDGPLWFLRDLMVIFLLTPVIIFILRKWVSCLFVLSILYMQPKQSLGIFSQVLV